jgi:2-keto-4-pentenoate hydratase
MSRLANALWEARNNGTNVDACALALEEAREVLADLVQRELATGREVVGWKIARLPLEGADDVFFAGPVFAHYDRPTSPLVRPRVEVEFVARIEGREGDGSWRLSWHVGLEIVDNHDREWCLDPAWCLADWAVHAAASLGGPCQTPPEDAPIGVKLVIGDRSITRKGRWRMGHNRMLATLDKDCEQLARPLQVGDLVWSGSLLPPEPLPVGASVQGSVDGYGDVSFR